MTHFPILIVIPKGVYVLGDKMINTYIETTMEQYDVNRKIPWHIALTAEQLKLVYEENKSENSHEYELKDFLDDYGYDLDDKGNAITDRNELGFYDYFKIGGNLTSYFKNFHDNSEIKNNVLPVSDLIDHFKDLSSIELIFDKHGTCHNSMNFNAQRYTESNHKTWLTDFQNILQHNRHHYAVSIHVHN